MGVRDAAVVVVMVMMMVMMRGVMSAPQDDITLNNGGYTGVTIAISEDLDEMKCAEYVNTAKDMIAAASQGLFSATVSKVFFRGVVIVVPEKWVCQGVNFDTPPRSYTLESGHVRVGPSHHLFGDNPWTQQPGGCGHPGDFIYVPENFLLTNTSYGSQGSVLVHEWAKYRWGVFEEYGHTGDHVFPAAYRNANNEYSPTYCTDQPVEGNLICSGGTEAECQFTPSLTANNTATSSLLAAPFLDTVVKFCDENSHNSAAPTKHNLLCGQKSVREVMNLHSDMQGIQSTLESTTFTVVRAGAAGPRMVLLLDYSSDMNGEHGRWEQLRDNVAQFLLAEAAAESHVGVVVFESKINTTSVSVLPLSVTGNREYLADIVWRERTFTTGSKNLIIAITRGSEMLGPEGGTLVLLTHNMVEYPASQDVIDAAANNAVWPVLYPRDPSVTTTVYDQLADISPDTSVLTVDNAFDFDTVSGVNAQSVQNSINLHQNLLSAVGSSATRVRSGSCSDRDCNINLDMTDNTEYIPAAYIKVFSSFHENLNYFRVNAKSPSGAALPVTNGHEYQTGFLFKINTLQNGQYEVSITGSNTNVDVTAELWATPATPLGLEVSVWSSQGLGDLQYLPGIAPPLFAKVTKDSSWPVLFADVSGKVADKGSTNTGVNITMNDAGFGADVTGNDGIYSGYLIGFEPNQDISISLTVTDNNGTAKVVNPSLRAAPVTQEKGACCGSQLDVSALQLETLGTFTLSQEGVSGRLTGESPGVLPPGRVTDLRSSSDGYSVTLTFTAPGAQLDQGTADGYEWKFRTGNEESRAKNFSGEPAGSLVQLRDTLPGCDKVYAITISAYYGGVRGGISNSVREIVSCSYNDGLSAGAIAGITIGCIFGVLLIVLIIYLCLNRDHLDELWVWQILTCRCLREKEEDIYKQPSTQASRTDVIRGNTNTSPSKPVRDITDLYTRPRIAKKPPKENKAQEEDDGGFGERRQRQETTQRRPAEDVESVSSSHSTLPINKVGVPVGSDNHGYDDDPYTIYRNLPPVRRPPRANTQV